MFKVESHHFEHMRKTITIVVGFVGLMLPATMVTFADQPTTVKLSVSRVMEMKATELKNSIEQELHAGLEEWKGMAESLSALQQYAIAELYLTGEVTGDVVQDRREAMFWLLKSAHKGLAEAQFRLGTWCRTPSSIFKLRDIIAQTPEEAFFWFKKAAESGYPPAFGALGNAYKDGNGCTKDIRLAKFWLTKAVIEHRSAYALESLLPLIDSEDELVRILTEMEKTQKDHSVLPEK